MAETNWVTVKIPETTRDKAQDDPRTYEEIMRAGLDTETTTQTTPQPQETTVSVDESELANEVATQLQLDMAQLASKTADEVERRLR